MSENTLFIVKPDAVARNLVGEVISRFEKKGFKILKLKMFTFTQEQAENFYGEHKEKPFFGELTSFITSGPVVEAIIEGIKQGCEKYPTKINLIGILSRTFGVENCETELNAILAHKDNITALDLAGDEYNFPGDLFERHFKKGL